jgi:hypothetical protein
VALDNLGAIMDAIAARIDAIPGLTVRTYPWPAAEVNPPAAVVGYPESVTFDMVYGRGADRADIPVYFVTGRVQEKSARDRLSAVIAGAQGVKEALDGDLNGTVDSCRVRDADVVPVQIGGVDYVAVKFTAEVIR